MTRRFVLLALAALPLAGCLESQPRGVLTLELLGPAYPRARCARGDASLGQLYPRGAPVQGAQVVLTPGELRGTSDAAGKVTFKDLPEGDYSLSVSSPTYQPAASQPVSMAPGKAVQLIVQLKPCIQGGEDRHRVGFGASTALSASNECGAAWAGASFSWTQVEGPDIRASVKTWAGETLRFTTAPIEKVRKLPDQPRILSFSPDEAGQYVFKVLGRRADGKISSDHVMVSSTDVAGGLNSVPPGRRYYFVGPKQGPWKWRIKKWPAGWIRTLEGEDTRTPSVLPLPPRTLSAQVTLEVEEVNSGANFLLNLGYWNMVNRDCGRYECHPALQASWAKTRHGKTWQKLVDGELKSARGEAAESCATCHALGHDRSVANWGYDDVADQQQVSFPATLRKGNYAKLTEAVKGVSNVYCLACHGPARVDPPVSEQFGRFAVGVCAVCHDRRPEQDVVHQWRLSGMSRTISGDVNGPEARKECARCHAAQAFYYTNFALGRPPNPKVVTQAWGDNLEPITCQVCHSPMYATNKAQVFRYGAVTTDSGLALTKVGAGALCATCHNTEHDVTAAATLARRLAPHSPQADLSYGRAGYALAAAGHPKLAGVACARTAGEGCVTCHMDRGPAAGQPGYRQVGGHTFRMISTGGQPNLRPCQACHGAGMTSFDPLGKGDFDGDGKQQGVRQEVGGLMALLRAQLGAALIQRGYRGCDPAKAAGAWVKAGHRGQLVLTDSLGVDLGDCDRNGYIERDEQAFTLPPKDELLHKAAYNYLLVQLDHSHGLHNLPYTVKLLQRTIHAVAGGKNLPGWELYP